MHRLKHFLPLTFVAALLTCPMPLLAAPAKAAASASQAGTPAELAQAEAKLWLVEMNGDQYGKAWDRAATLFQNEIARDKWEVSMIRIRGMLGSAENRKLVSASPQNSLPGMPDGHYVVITWATKFEQKARALEVVTVMQEKDGRWKVAGYVIR